MELELDTNLINITFFQGETITVSPFLKGETCGRKNSKQEI